MFSCYECGDDWTSPTESGRCIPCCQKLEAEYKMAKVAKEEDTEGQKEKRDKKKMDKKIEKERQRQKKFFGRELI